MKLIYHPATQNYAITDGANVAMINGYCFNEDLHVLFSVFCTEKVDCAIAYSGFPCSDYEILGTFSDKADAKNKFAEYLI